jgi:hypothetical protein
MITWDTYENYSAHTSYAFRTFVKIPAMPPRVSGNVFFLEWAYNESGPMHGAAAQALAPEVRALRGAKVEFQSTNEGDAATVWMYIWTVTPIGTNGSIEVELPYHNMVFTNYTDDEGTFIRVDVIEFFGSAPMPPNLKCRRVYYEQGGEDRLQLYANISGIAPGHYVFEFNMTVPPEAAPNPLSPTSACGSDNCFTFFSMVARPLALVAPPPAVAGEYVSPQTNWISGHLLSREEFIEQNDYWTTIPARRITTPMRVAGIVNLTLDERLATARDDRPLERSALVFAFMLDTYNDLSASDWVQPEC